MPQLERGDIVVERLTGTRVIVINATPAADDLTVRFPDGRLEDRFAFELEQPQTLLDLLRDLLTLSLAWPWPTRAIEYGAPPARPRPQLLRQ
jgi:hypothetical protein